MVLVQSKPWQAFYRYGIWILDIRGRSFIIESIRTESERLAEISHARARACNWQARMHVSKGTVSQAFSIEFFHFTTISCDGVARPALIGRLLRINEIRYGVEVCMDHKGRTLNANQVIR